MIRKLKLMIVPSAGAEGVAGLWEAYHEDGWPADWGPLERAANEAAKTLRRETDDLARLVKAVDRSGAVAVVEFDPTDDDDVNDIGLDGYAIEVDLPLVFDDRKPAESFRALAALVSFVDKSIGYYADAKLGTKTADDVDEVIEAIHEQASSGGIELDESAQPDVRFSDHEVRFGKGKTSGSKRKKHSGNPSTGSFGGLRDEDRAPDRTPALSDAEKFFLTFSGLSWPVTAAQLEDARKNAILRVHPDRNADDPSAQGRFIVLQEGHRELKRRLDS